MASKNNNPIQSFYNWYRSAIRHPVWGWVIGLVTVAYLVSPIDISPDFIPVIGWLDDGILATLLITEVSSLAMDYLKRGKAGNNTTVAEADDAIDVEAEVG